jgi:type I restriction enzyme S subunit
MTYKRYPKYKDSGVEWLGEIPAHWEIENSRRLFSLRRERAYADDKQLTASQKHGILFQDDFMIIEDQKVTLVLKNIEILKHVEPNDFVISMRSFQGGLELSNLRGCISSAYVMIIPSSRIEPIFFKWLFKSDVYIQALQSTSNLIRDGQALRFENFALVTLPLIPLPTQKAIAAFLDAETARIDSLIQDYKELIALLQEKRQALISHAVTRGLSELVSPDDPEFGQWAKPVKFKDSGVEWLGEIPEGWEVCPLKYVVLFKSGYAFPSDAFVEEGIPLLRIGNITPIGEINFDDAKYLPDHFVELFKDFLIAGDELIMAMTGATIGKLGKFEFESQAFLNQRVCSFSGTYKLYSQFLRYFLNSDSYQEYIRITAFGGAQPNISESELTCYPICFPNILTQQGISAFLDRKTEKMDALVTEAQCAIALLKEHRSALITNAVTGKISVERVV